MLLWGVRNRAKQQKNAILGGFAWSAGSTVALGSCPQRSQGRFAKAVVPAKPSVRARREPRVRPGTRRGDVDLSPADADGLNGVDFQRSGSSSRDKRKLSRSIQAAAQTPAKRRMDERQSRLCQLLNSTVGACPLAPLKVLHPRPVCELHEALIGFLIAQASTARRNSDRGAAPAAHSSRIVRLQIAEDVVG